MQLKHSIYTLTTLCLLIGTWKTLPAQKENTSKTYKPRVLNNTEVEVLTSLYHQKGNHAAVSGGLGSENLRDIATSIIVNVPVSDDDVLTLDGSISAYTSASSSNINPFDGKGEADPFVASSGASSGDVWLNLTATYAHHSDDRKRIFSRKVSISNEHDYFSVGLGGSSTWIMNHKNTEFSAKGNIYLDTWLPFYPTELRPFMKDGRGLNDNFFYRHTITGNTNYQPRFKEFDNVNRNSYSLGFTFSQVLSKRLQASWSVDLVQQEGLLSTPFQRVYFADVAGSYIEGFHLADDIERLPGIRRKLAMGMLANYYVNEHVVLRTFVRRYMDNWNIYSNTFSLEIPVKLTMRLTIYPSYRYYDQTAASYFAPYNQHLSSEEFYTSDYDLTHFRADQFGMGLSYTDVFATARIGRFGLKNLDLRIHRYMRNINFQAFLISAGARFVVD